MKSISWKPAAFALGGLVLALQGCMLFGGGDTMYCGDRQTAVFTKLLTPSDRNFELSLAPGDSAFTDGTCSAEFQMAVGFENDSLRAAAQYLDPRAMPLTRLAGDSVFFMNDTTLLRGGFTGTAPPPDFYPPFRSGDLYLSSYMNPAGPTRRGTYSIKTSLSPSVTNADSSVRVTARIRFQKG